MERVEKAMTGAGAAQYWRACVGRFLRGGMKREKAEKEVRKCEDRLEGVKPGQPVLYYNLGWRVGHAAEKPHRATLKIQPIPPRNAAPLLPVYVPCEDVRFIEPRYLRRPWGLLPALRTS